MIKSVKVLLAGLILRWSLAQGPVLVVSWPAPFRAGLSLFSGGGEGRTNKIVGSFQSLGRPGGGLGVLVAGVAVVLHGHVLAQRPHISLQQDLIHKIPALQKIKRRF